MPTAAKRYRPHGVQSGGSSDHTFNSYQRGYGKRWQRAAVQFIREQVAIDPRCRYCWKIPMSNGNRRPYDVDHSDPPSRHGAPGSAAYLAVFWDQSRWVLSCISCNAAKQDRIR